MTSIECTAYPRLGTHPSTAELAEVWSPTPEEAELGKATTRAEGHVARVRALMLKSFRRLGYFPLLEEPR